MSKEHVYVDEDDHCVKCGQSKWLFADQNGNWIDYDKSMTCRPSKAEMWMNIAKEIAKQSCDLRLKVCAIVVPEDNAGMLACGYNGNYKGGPNKSESLEPGQSGFIHAEQNCLVKLDFNFPKKKHMYVTHSPCRMCSKLIVNANIARVVYNELYRDTSGLDILKSSGVEVFDISDAILID